MPATEISLKNVCISLRPVLLIKTVAALLQCGHFEMKQNSCFVSVVRPWATKIKDKDDTL